LLRRIVVGGGFSAVDGETGLTFTLGTALSVRPGCRPDRSNR
jgi:hypothetical protein